MPGSLCKPPFRNSSESPPYLGDSPASSGIFTPKIPDKPRSGGKSPFPSSLSPKPTEPFPDGLFRVPVPDEVFSEMPEMSDSALRALLALIGLTFEYDTEKARWTAPERSFTRAEVETACGLSGQGTRDGLSELEEAGYVRVNRSRKSYEHALEMGVPSSRYTYLPATLLEKARELSGAELRMVLTVFRATWGWTGNAGGGEPTHKRWARLSTGTLAGRTGRSASAVKKAARALSGTLLARRRPDNGAYYYRISPEGLRALKGGPEESMSTETLTVQVKKRAFFSARVPKNLPPDRQQSDPPRRKGIESFPERNTQHSAPSKRAKRSQRTPNHENRGSVVRKEQSPEDRAPSASSPNARKEATSPRKSNAGRGRRTQPSDEDVDLTGFSKEKQALGQKLANVGVWPRCIPELLGRFSARRIKANFELYRTEASDVEKPGAWLYAAIAQGYASVSEGHSSPRGDTLATGESRAEDSLGHPEPGTEVSTTQKRALIQKGVATGTDFEKFADYDDPSKKQHFFRVEKSPSRAARM